MRFDLDALPPEQAYKLLTATVVPRPIAWVVTSDGLGRLNAAPFSFFNVMGSNPPIVAVGFTADPERGFKDSARNILETGEFVINLVPEALIEAMNHTAVDAPSAVDELALAGLKTAPSEHVTPPRIAESPVAFECRRLHALETGPHQLLVVGRVLAVHIEDAYVKDAVRGHVHTDRLRLVGRMFGAGYVRLSDTFELARPTWAELEAQAPLSAATTETVTAVKDT